MKNVIKKITAVAMAFTLIGTGTVVTKKINPNTIPTFEAHAEFAHNCSCYKSMVSCENWKYVLSGTEYTPVSCAYTPLYEYDLYVRDVTYRCNVCGNEISYTEHKKQITKIINEFFYNS